MSKHLQQQLRLESYNALYAPRVPMPTVPVTWKPPRQISGCDAMPPPKSKLSSLLCVTEIRSWLWVGLSRFCKEEALSRVLCSGRSLRNVGSLGLNMSAIPGSEGPHGRPICSSRHPIIRQDAWQHNAR